MLKRNTNYIEVAKDILIRLPAHAAGEIWQEMKSISFEILSGEDPEKVKRQVEKMVSDCQSRSNELKNLTSSPDFVNKFNEAKGKLEQGTAVVATVTHAILASYGIELATIAGMDATGGVITAAVGCFIIMAGVKQEELKKQYDKAVETCAYIYQQDAQYLEEVAAAHRRKLDTNRSYLLGKINNLNQQILQLNKELAAEITLILENHLSRKISPSELGELFAEYKDLFDDQIRIFGQKVETISSQIAKYNEILNNEQALVDYVQE